MRNKRKLKGRPRTMQNAKRIITIVPGQSYDTIRRIHDETKLSISAVARDAIERGLKK